jgi:hypothetical protein
VEQSVWGIADTSGKKVSDKINICGWPSIKGFRQFRLAFKKAVAAASVRPDAAFVWVCQIEKVQSMEELCDSIFRHGMG